MSYNVGKPKKRSVKIRRRNTKNMNEDNFIKALDTVRWDVIDEFAPDDVENKAKVLEILLSQVIDDHAPFETIIIHENNRPRWMNPEIETMMNERDELLDKFNKTKNHKYKKEWRTLRNILSQKIRKTKKALINKECNKEVANTKTFFNNLKKNEIIPDKKKKFTNDEAFSAAQLNETFLENNNGETDQAKIEEVIKKIKSENVKKINTTSFKLKNTSVIEIKKIIRSLKSKSSGVDDISGAFVKLAINHISEPLAKIINAAYKFQKFPERWKKAIVIPIPKIDNPLHPSDYRPISLLTVFAKIAEKATSYQMIQYLRENQLEDIYQSAYKENHGTTTALLNLTEDIYNALDDNELTILVMIDYSKAFDTINHRILCAKMETLNFHSSTINFIASYLKDRQQKVRTRKDESEWETLRNGVPQGSVLGPLLYSIMVHDIGKCFKEGKYSVYADDTAEHISTKMDEINNAVDKVNQDLTALSKYSSDNCLKINHEKSNYIIIGSQKQVSKLKTMEINKVKIDNIPLKRKTHSKHLGLTFDEVLSWTEHVKLSNQKAMFTLKRFFRLKNFLSIPCKKRLTETYVLSQLNYCNIVTQGMNNDLKTKTQRVQNMSTRFIFSLKKYDHTTEYLIKMKSLNMKSRTKLHSLTMMHKIMLGQAPKYLIDRICMVKNIHNRTTRNNNLLYVKKLKKAKKNGSFFNQTAIDYNELIAKKQVTTDMTIRSFRKKCRKILLEEQVSRSNLG